MASSQGGGDRGGEPEPDQRVGNRQVLGARHPSCPGVRVLRPVSHGNHHVLHRPQRLDPRRLGRAREATDSVRLNELAGIDEQEPELHLLLPRFIRSTGLGRSGSGRRPLRAGAAHREPAGPGGIAPAPRRPRGAPRRFLTRSPPDLAPRRRQTLTGARPNPDQGLPKVAIRSTRHSNSTRLSSMAGSRRP